MKKGLFQMTLQEAFKPYFKIGVAVAIPDITEPANIDLIRREFNSITCENHMKPMYILDSKENLNNPEAHNLEPAVTFDICRPFLDFAKENNLPMRGHTLGWHNQTPKWFFHEDYNEEKPLANRDTMIARLQNYIKAVFSFINSEYPDMIYAWDVFNEIVEDNAFRKSLWTETIGEDFFFFAFEAARKYSVPGTQLFYNDYDTFVDWKRDFIYEKVLLPLKEKGLVDGMGMQSHLTMDHPNLADYKIALEKYGSTGLIIHMTELDIHNNDDSESSMKALADRYSELFTIILDAKKTGKANVECVTFWNLLDEESWLTGFRKETSHPLLFHKNCEAKEAYYAVLKTVE